LKVQPLTAALAEDWSFPRPPDSRSPADPIRARRRRGSGPAGHASRPRREAADCGSARRRTRHLSDDLLVALQPNGFAASGTRVNDRPRATLVRRPRGCSVPSTISRARTLTTARSVLRSS